MTDIQLQTIITTTMLLIIIILISYFIHLSISSRRTNILELDENLNEDAYPIIKDLLDIINYECNKVFDVNFTSKATKHVYSLDHSKLINPTMVIRDEDVNKATIDVHDKIFNNFSDVYKKRLYKVINPDHLEDFIMEEIYRTLFNRAIEMNKSTMRK